MSGATAFFELSQRNKNSQEMISRPEMMPTKEAARLPEPHRNHLIKPAVFRMQNALHLELQAQTCEQMVLDESVGVGWGCKHTDR